MRRVLRLARKLVALTLATALAITAAAWGWWHVGDRDGDMQHQRSRGLNALWARHAWVGEPHSSADYDALADRLTRAQISDVYFHAGPFNGDGTVDPEKYTNAPTLLAELAARAPQVRAQAYLGQVLRRSGGPLDLDDARTRDNIVATAETFLRLGFHGIHYDIEPIYPGDLAFLDLLERTHELTRRHNALLSTAVEQLEMVPGAQRVLSKIADRYHDPTRPYLREVARRVDQVAIMTYDTGLPFDFLFGAHMAWQTEHVVDLVHDATGGRTAVLMGVPTYDYDTAGFHPRAENVASGVEGVRRGLAALPAHKAKNVGIALYPEWTMSDADWRAYMAAWVP